MKKLIISDRQMIRLNEADLYGADNKATTTATYSTNGNITGQDVTNAANQAGNDVDQVTVTSTANTGGPDITVDNTNGTMNIPQDAHSVSGPVSESISLKKSDIKRIQKKKGNVFTKKDFKKKLDEDYKSFSDSLNERRKNYGK